MDNIPEEIKKIRFIPFESFYRILKGAKNKEEYQEIEKFYKIKKALYDLIFKIHQEKYGNIDLSFDKSTLDGIGFRCCRGEECRNYHSTY